MQMIDMWRSINHEYKNEKRNTYKWEINAIVTESHDEDKWIRCEIKWVGCKQANESFVKKKKSQAKLIE